MLALLQGISTGEGPAVEFMVILKVICGSEIRRLGKLEPLTYDRVLQLVGDAWPQEVAYGICLKYNNEHGQLCTLTMQTMEDALNHMKNTANGAVLKLDLQQGSLPATLLAEAPSLMASTALQHVSPIPPGVPAMLMEPTFLKSAGARMTPAPPEPARTAAAQEAQRASQALPGCDSEALATQQATQEQFPTHVAQKCVLMHNHNAMEVTLHWSVWSVWPGIWREGAVACFGASISPWVPRAKLEIRLPGECEALGFWNVGLTRLTEDGLLTLMLSPHESCDFSGTFCFPNLDAHALSKKLLEALQD